MTDVDPTLEASRFEKLGSFYLGRVIEPDGSGPAGAPLLYEARDLTTHAVAVGMTGSGKTGLCLSLLEEAALDGIPAIAIDPKGDLGNLLLTFPELAPGDFLPWVDPAKAEREGLTREELADREAAQWKEGLRAWGQDGSRIAALREAVDLAIYTPGAGHGMPLSMLGSLAAPAADLVADADALRERVSSAASALLALVGVEADPLHSRDHILLAHIIEGAWRDERNLDLEALIRAIQDPGFDRVGVLELESFYPSRERFELAMRLNNLLAAPGFQAWLEGEPLDVERLLWTPEGKPRVSIVSIAHLGDAERMFLVTLLLNEVVAWIRTRPGTAGLRAILYMDEVFGYLPPVRMPPSKPPLLTLLKQARAFGLGIVLATQNPVDLDYKALSNAGTWFLGRLQTERDKGRVLDGLEGATAFSAVALGRGDMDRVLSGLDSRVFLLNNVHEDAPVLFRTRWAMSYLRGPLARPEIRRLTEERVAAGGAGRTVPGEARPGRVPAGSESGLADGGRAPRSVSVGRPALPPEIEEIFLRAVGRADGPPVYRPALLAEADLHYSRAGLDVDEWRRVTCLALLGDDVPPDPWSEAVSWPDPPPVADAPPRDAEFAVLPPDAARPASYRRWTTALKGHLYREQPLHLWKCASPKLVSRPGESEGEFRVRLREEARVARDEAVDEFRERYAAKLRQAGERVKRAGDKVDREESQYSQHKLQTAISVGASVLDVLIGRKAMSRGTLGRATTAARGAGRAARERDEVRRAAEELEEATGRLRDLEAELEARLDEIRSAFAPEAVELERVSVPPRKSDIAVRRLVLAWTPWWRTATGGWAPAWGDAPTAPAA